MLVDRVPPQNLEAEEGVLGSILLDARCLDEIRTFLSPTDFYRAQHEATAEVLWGMNARGQAIDARLAHEPLAKALRLSDLDCLDYVGSLVNGIPHAANALHYAQIVRQKSLMRRLIEESSHTIQEVYANEHTSEDLLASAELRILSLGSRHRSGAVLTGADLMESTISKIDSRQMGGHTGITTGFFDLDDYTGGFEPGMLIYMAGRTSMGKSALVANIADYVAVERRQGVLFFSLETGRNQLGERLLAARGIIPLWSIHRGELDEPQYRRFENARVAIAESPLLIDDGTPRTAAEIAAVTRAMVARDNPRIKLVIIDLINHVADDGSKSIRERFSNASRTFKSIARGLDIPVIVVAQLSRETERSDGNRPRMSHLKESGALEEDADQVILLHRPEYYDADDQPGVAHVIVAKNRDGATGTATLTFLRDKLRFENQAVQGVMDEQAAY